MKEQFTLLEGLEDYTVDDYINLMVKNSDITSIEKKSKDGLTWFEYTYENTSTEEVYRYFIYVYKTHDAFWSVQFALLDEKADSYRNEIFNWAKSVKFDG